MPDTVGNYSDYMSIVNDYASCIEAEGESVYFSMNETVRNSPRDNEEGNNTLNELEVTQIGDTTLQHEDIPTNKPNENFISSTPNKEEPRAEGREQIFDTSTVNKSVNGFSEVSQMLRQISTKLQTVQNKENINTDTNTVATTIKPLEVKIIKPKKATLQKPLLIITAPDVRNIPCEKIVNKNLGQAAPSTNIQKRMSIRSGPIPKPQFMRKSLIPAKVEVKDNKESPTEMTSTKDPAKKGNMARKSIIPKSMSTKQVTSALNVATKPRASLLHSQKTSNIRRSLEKLNIVINKKPTQLDSVKTSTSTSSNRKTLNPRRTMASIVPNQKTTSPAPKLLTPTLNNRNNLNQRRSVAKLPGTFMKEIETFECSKCKRKFRMETNYITHLNSHTNSIISDLVCKYCDKKFQLTVALHTHLRDNCTKIPAREKRLLPTSNSGMTPSSKNNSKTSSVDSLSKNTYLAINPTALDSELMKPPSGIPTAFMYQETKKLLKSLHSGVGHTPKKINMCKKCGKIFYNICALQAHKTCEDSDDDEVEVAEQK